GSLRAPDYLALSPAGRIPALEIDGRVLHESGAISEYLCETRPAYGFGRAPGHAERAEWLEWLHFAETMGTIIANLNLHWIFLRDPASRSPALLRLEARRLAVTLEAVEQVLARQDHLLAGGFSAADTMMGWNLLAAPRFVRMDDFPAIRDYQARMQARPAWQKARALDGEQMFYRQPFYEVQDG
ncbi:MAG: glutathione S-transferase family protein, partial [Rhodobacteraceae bacterium]|nr:glutathione S-transferase family protein [Paracoccaceae bacterium]